MSKHSQSRAAVNALWLARLLTVLVALGVAVGVAAYLSGRFNVPRHRVESATVAFVVVGALSHFALTTRSVPNRPGFAALPGEWTLWIVAAAVLYWPSLWLGPLSDDYALADRARHGAVGLVHAEFLRPLPLLAWGALLRLQTGWVGLHLLNVAAHGTVAFLATRLAVPLLPSRPTTVAVGLLILTFPAAVEAVSWASGVFDVTATLLAIATVLASRRYTAHTRRRTRAAMVACACAALLCKETAAVIPALIGLDMWVSKRWPRSLIWDGSALAVSFGCIGAARLWFASDAVRQPVTKYVLQRWLFGTIGGLTVPWHSEIVGAWPWVPVTGAILAIGVATVFFVTRSAVATTRVAVAALGWLLLGTLPALTFFFIAPDLQQSRYLYLPAVGYMLLLVTMASRGRASDVRGLGVVALLVVLGVFGVRQHQTYWQRAAAARDAVLNAARTDRTLRACPTTSIRGLPDTVAGAYVFRNGAELAFAAEGVVLSASAPPSCTFSWDMARATLAPIP
jgi:hypothetical protein